jgi:hypothetical protein
MDIGTEDDREIYITRPAETPVERPTTIPAPQEAPTEPVKTPAGV